MSGPPWIRCLGSGALQSHTYGLVAASIQRLTAPALASAGPRLGKNWHGNGHDLHIYVVWAIWWTTHCWLTNLTWRRQLSICTDFCCFYHLLRSIAVPCHKAFEHRLEMAEMLTEPERVRLVVSNLHMMKTCAIDAIRITTRQAMGLACNYMNSPFQIQGLVSL